jgi:hypothetical protein
MAKKISAPSKIEKAISKPAAKAVVSTAVRNSPIPKPKAVAARPIVEITSERIACRAFEIYASGKGGSEVDNWFQAERELRGNV